jgi:hypothetical protein
MKLNRTQGTLVGVVALLQAVFTAASAINGGLAGLFINDKAKAVIGFGAIFLAILIAATLTVSGEKATTAKARRRVTIAGGTAVVLFMLGMVVTAYAAVVIPSRKSQPEISAVLHAGTPLILDGTVKANGIPRGVGLNVYVDGAYEAKGQYFLTDPTLYQAHIGADPTGKVAHTFTVLIPTNTYDAIAIDAWAGSETKCAPPPARSDRSSGHKGCIFMRIADVGGRKSKGLPRPQPINVPGVTVEGLTQHTIGP